MSDLDFAALQAQFFAALNAGDEQALRAAGLQMGEQAARDFPAFHAALNALGYHNRLSLINDMMRAAWQQVQDDRDYSRPAVEAYAGRATDHILYTYLEESNRNDDLPITLIERLEVYFPVEMSRLQSYVALLSGDVGRPWSAADFEPLKMPALSGLMIEFMGYANRTDVPYARAHLLRDALPRYLLDRQAGNLQPRPDVAALLRNERRPFPEPSPQPLHPLVPDQPTLSLFLQRMLQTAFPLPYASAAVLNLLPRWLDFLQFRQLVSAGVVDTARSFLPGLRRELAPYWSDHPDRSLQAIG